MNQKAEKFQQYLDQREEKAFTPEEIQDDSFHTVVFRSFAEVQGNRLPLMIVLDDSIYGIVRLLVAPKARHDENETKLLQKMNEYNRQYKCFKYYFDEEGNLLLDTCILFKDDEAVDGELIYAVLNVMLQHLNENYKSLMQVIWD